MLATKNSGLTLASLFLACFSAGVGEPCSVDSEGFKSCALDDEEDVVLIDAVSEADCALELLPRDELNLEKGLIGIVDSGVDCATEQDDEVLGYGDETVDEAIGGLVFGMRGGCFIEL